MKSIFFIAIALMFSFASFSQSKPKKHEAVKSDTSVIKPIEKKLFITVDSADAANFLTIIKVGIDHLIETQIPANQIPAMNKYGTDLFYREAAVYNMWFAPPPAPKKDSTTKKP